VMKPRRYCFDCGRHVKGKRRRCRGCGSPWTGEAPVRRTVFGSYSAVGADVFNTSEVSQSAFKVVCRSFSHQIRRSFKQSPDIVVGDPTIMVKRPRSGYPGDPLDAFSTIGVKSYGELGAVPGKRRDFYRERFNEALDQFNALIDRKCLEMTYRIMAAGK